MSLGVDQLTRHYLNKRNIPESSGDTTSFSTELTEDQLAKLKFLADRFDASEFSVASNLLDAAMEDALSILGAFDSMSYEETQTVPIKTQLEVVEKQVEQIYRYKIQRIKNKGVS